MGLLDHLHWYHLMNYDMQYSCRTNTYVIDLLDSMGIFSTFKVNDLCEFKDDEIPYPNHNSGSSSFEVEGTNVVDRRRNGPLEDKRMQWEFAE